MSADLDRQEITTTLSSTTRLFIMAKLALLWEEGVDAAEGKKEKYTELSAVCSQARRRVFTYSVEVGCRGYPGTSSQLFLKSLGASGAELRKELSRGGRTR